MTMPFMLHSALIRAHALQRPFRTLLSIAGVALGVLASVAIGTANIQVLRSFEQAVTTVAGPATLEIAGHDLGVDEAAITAIRTVDGVISAVPVIEESVVLNQGEARGQALQILGLDLLAEVGTRGFQISQAETNDALEALLAPDALYLGRQVAADWKLKIGSTVEVMVGGRLVRLRVAGLIHNEAAGSSLWDRLAVMDIAAAQLLFQSIGRVDRIELVTAPDRTLDDIIVSLRAVLPPHIVVQRPAQRTKQVENMVWAFQLNLSVMSWVGLLVGVFLIYNTIAFAVAQRRREIGIYRALGMTERRVAGLFFVEAGLLGLLGGLLGGLGGVWLARGLVSLVSRTVSDLYAPVTSGGLILSMDMVTLTAVAKGVLLGTVVSMVGALGPSVEASRTVTVRALAPGDYESTNQLRAGLWGWISLALLVLAGLCSLVSPVGNLPLFGYFATVCLLGALSCFAPMCIKALGWRPFRRDSKTMVVGGSLRLIAADQAARHPGRNAVTVSALMVGLSIMIGVVVMVRSFRDTVEFWVDETVMADLIVAPQSWLQGKQSGQASRALPGGWRSTLSAIDGIDAVDTYREAYVGVEGQSVALVSRDLRLHAQRSRYLMVRGDSSTALRRAAETGGALLSEVLATRLQLREGDKLTITTPSGPAAVSVEGIFYDYATDGGKMVMDRTWYQQQWHDDRVTVFSVYLAAGADVDRVKQSIVTEVAGLDGMTLPPLVIRNHELRQEILDIFDRSFVLTYVLEAIAVLVAVLGIVNTLVTAVLERRREFAALRAIGASTGQVERLVLWEAAYLGLIGAALGVAGGLLLALLLIHVINKQSFGWTIQMTVPGGVILQAVGLALTAALAAGYWPARWAARQPVVEGLREE
ncbi:MAG: FtsX-like permease family protein [Nitrospira sp. CG24C]|nr:MAG: FtsX-like permease family protein [Nitrospira sp. CG24C]